MKNSHELQLGPEGMILEKLCIVCSCVMMRSTVLAISKYDPQIWWSSNKIWVNFHKAGELFLAGSVVIALTNNYLKIFLNKKFLK